MMTFPGEGVVGLFVRESKVLPPPLVDGVFDFGSSEDSAGVLDDDREQL
jgi:hypothetical protein